MKNRKIASIVSVLLAACMLFGACNNGKTPTSSTVSDPIDTSVSVSSEPATSASVEPEPKVEAPKKVVFDLTKTHQVMDGFGAAYTWYGDRLLNAENSAEGLDALFSDAKLTILRFKNEYEYTIPGKANNAVAMARNYKEARERAAKYGEKVQVLLCCWAPPASLKSDGTNENGKGTIRKNPDGTYMYKEYADWWVDSVKYYMSKGIQIDYVSIQNEIDFSPEDYEGCRFGTVESATEASYAKAFIAVYDAFKEEFGENAPKLLGPETMGCSNFSLVGYTRDILKERPEALEGLAFHLYASGTSDGDDNTVKPSSYLTVFSDMNRFFPDTKKWETEFYIGRGIQTAELIWYALTTANLNAYLYWSGVWDDSTPDKFESADLVEINSKGEWRLSANYYAMRHFSEFIRPGYTRVDSSSEAAFLKTTAFMNENGSKIAAVLVNPSDKEVTINLSGKEYTITDSAVYQSVFGDECKSDENLYKNIGSLDENGTIVIPAKSVTTVDITGYPGDTKVTVPPIKEIVYDNEVITEVTNDPAPLRDKVMISTSFEDDSIITAFQGFGNSILRRDTEHSADGNGCAAIKYRSADWNGALLSSGYFDYYGYLVWIAYDVMMETEGATVSCTSTFTVENSTYYPDGENNRVACYDMEAGKWYHVEGYVTMYDNMKPESFSVYWESPGNNDNIYLDNVEVKIMYTMPAGSYEK